MEYLKIMNKYGDKSEYVIINFPAYGLERDVQSKRDVDAYTDIKFEDTSVMIFKNYDNVLRKVFGDYMKLPPESERVSRHDMKIWWRDNYDSHKK